MKITAENIDREAIEDFLEVWQIGENTVTADELIQKIVDSVNRMGENGAWFSDTVFFGPNDRYEVEVDVDDEDDPKTVTIYPTAYGTVLDKDSVVVCSI